MSEIVERVARAIYDSNEFVRGWDHPKTKESWKVQYRKKAVWAIKAMRDPNVKMLKAACASMSPGKRPTPERVCVKEKHRIRYGAMIDAAIVGSDGTAS